MGNTIYLLDVADPPAAGLDVQLWQCGFTARTASDLETAARLVRGDAPALVVVRIGHSSHVDTIRGLRMLPAVPVVVICTGQDADLVIRCLDAGADTVLTEPLSRRELAVRIRAALGWRREHIMPGGWCETHPHCVGDLTIDIEGHLVIRDGSRVALTPTEFRLLAALARRPGETVNRVDLLSEVWGAARADKRDNLRPHIRSLRRKLEKHHGEPSLLLSERGVGYRLAAGAA